MKQYECTNPGTLECFLLGVLYNLVLGPLGWLLGLFGYDFYWGIE
jgi:hypothetical protein